MTGQKEKGLRRLAPLIGIFLFVFTTTGAISYIGGFSELMEVGKIFMGTFFLVFGGFKVYNLEGFISAFQSYDPLARRSKKYAAIYPFIELSLGFLYFALIFQTAFVVEVIVYTATIAVMGLNGSGVAHALLNDRDLKCACLGDVFNVPMTTVTLVEDLGMAVMAVLMLVSIL